MELENTWHLSEMTIHGDIRETDNPYQYGDELMELINNTLHKVRKRKIRNPQKLLKLIEQYPNVPAFKNFLTVLYNLQGKKEKAEKANRWLIKEHPDYLYGKLNLCAEYLRDGGDPERVLDVLGKNLSLSSLYPERKVFHATEFLSFTNIVIHYLLETDRVEAAESHLEIIKRILGERDDHYRSVAEHIEKAKRIKIFEVYEDRLEARWDRLEELENLTPDLPTQVNGLPELQHSELLRLYEVDVDIDSDFYNQLLDLPRESLLEDLRLIITECAERQVYLEDQLEGNGNFPGLFYLHAWGIAADLKATELLEDFLLALDKPMGRVADYWLHDHLTETIWHFAYRIIAEHTDRIFEILRSSEYGNNAKMVLLQLLEQQFVQVPDKRKAIKEGMEGLFQFILDHLEYPRLTSEEFITYFVGAVGETNEKDLIQKLEILFDLSVVDFSFFGEYEDFLEGIERYGSFSRKFEVPETTLKAYQIIKDDWYGYNEEEDEVQESDLEALHQALESTAYPKEKSDPLPTRTTSPQPTKKVGRNAPCPCGSGRKYKHCCLKKT